MKDVHGQIAQIQATAGQSLAPKRTGMLAGSIRPTRQAARVVIKAGGARVPYAAVIHWGWPAHGITANPWLSRAAQQTEPTWTTVYADGVQKILDTVMDEAQP